MDKDVSFKDSPTSSRRLDFGQEKNISNGIHEENEKEEQQFVDLENENVMGDHEFKIPKDKIPRIGMEFDSEEMAYQFYNEYARASGFSVRRSSVHKDSQQNIIDRIFCCSCQGQRGYDKREVNFKSHRPETRTGCCAHMKINSRYTGKYIVVEFVADHNGHNLVSPNKVHFLRSHRTITTQQAIQLDNLDKSGIPPKASLDYMAEQVGGRENVGFILEDLRNYLHSKRTIQMKEGDAGGVLNYLQLKQSEDPNFFYAIQVDKDDLITNVFWADGQMMADYMCFGDVVCFDTTYRKAKEGRPFALFVGVNHHKQINIYGAALLYDETAETFMWLFDAFAKCMNGKTPITILTDQDAAMAKALQEKWPETCHRLCIWHIYQNAASHLNSVFSSFQDFSKDFSSCIYDYEEEEDFIDAWHDMLDKYGLQTNDWLERMFKKKEKWALVYGRQVFCADITSTQRSESMNSVLKKYVSHKYNLLQFFHHFTRLIDNRRYREMEADLRTNHSTPKLSFAVEILKHARTIYTHEVFKLFQKELSKAHDAKLEIVGDGGIISQYKITPFRKKYEHDLYIKKRWTKKAKKGITEVSSKPSATLNEPSKDMKEENEKVRIGERYRELCRLHNQLATRAALTEETFESAKNNLHKIIEEVDVKLDNIGIPKPTSIVPKISVKKSVVSKVAEKQLPASQLLEKQVLEPSYNANATQEKVEKKSDESVIRGWKVKQTKVKSGKRPKSALEKATKRRKPKQNKNSSSSVNISVETTNQVSCFIYIYIALN
ncbi:hypothetical protein ACJIZ3_023740 [Penstemon smallii]|uniref:Protein FAR1-RELATED SEQUENCE n=1 Tax=Penstemon smallii TaxID=265156 RepID=A0ABD3TPW5_9LAMI